MESKGDPDLVLKAALMRSQGLSWTQIASNLGIGKTTARRLVRLYKKEDYPLMRSDAENILSNRTVSCDYGEDEDEQDVKDGNSIEQPKGGQLSLDDDVLNKMPKTFQIFNSFLEKARQKQTK